jgi:hypothetical protein
VAKPKEIIEEPQVVDVDVDPAPPTMPLLDVELVAIDSLTEDPQNARVHGDRNLAATRVSLERFGQRKPIVVRRSDRVVLAGNATLRCARDLGWSQLYVAWTDLEGDEALAFAIADNRTAELAEWDKAALLSLTADLSIAFLDLSGFSPKELEAFQPPTAPDEFKAFDNDLKTEHRCPKCGYEWSGISHA